MSADVTWEDAEKRNREWGTKYDFVGYINADRMFKLNTLQTLIIVLTRVAIEKEITAFIRPLPYTSAPTMLSTTERFFDEIEKTLEHLCSDVKLYKLSAIEDIHLELTKVGSNRRADYAKLMAGYELALGPLRLIDL